MVIEALGQRFQISLIPPSIPQSIQNGLAMLTTFVLVSIAWVFFRAPDFNTALYILTHFFKTGGASIITTYDGAALSSELQMAITILAIVILVIYDVLDAYSLHVHSQSINRFMSQLPGVVRWRLYYGGLVYIIAAFVLSVGSLNDFIYFQF
jgi:hypothetical protein